MPYKDLQKRKEKNAEYSKKYYEDDKAKAKLRTKTTKQRNRAMWEAFKATLSCTLCGEKHPATFDFHHLVRSKDNIKIHKILTNGAFKKLPAELAKCVVLCANCHRIGHWYEQHGAENMHDVQEFKKYFKISERLKKGAEAP